MTCNVCKNITENIPSSFPTQSVFEQTQTAMGQLVDTAALTLLSSGLVQRYQCSTCSGQWELAIPDGAMRGGLTYISSRQLRIIQLHKKLSSGT